MIFSFSATPKKEPQFMQGEGGMKKFLVLGLGMQGQAIASALRQLSDPKEVITADILSGKADRVLDVNNPNALQTLLKEVQGGVVVSAISYTLNTYLTQQCIQAGVSLVDLGGNTEVVLKQHQSHSAAEKAHVTISPDNGLMPGMGNILAGSLVRHQKLQNIFIYCGGLPPYPINPLGYKLVFNPEGLINEYQGKTTLIQNGELKEIEAFSDCRPFTPHFTSPYTYESFYTSGGVSTAAHSFLGKAQNYTYRTVRYQGHFEKLKLIKDFGWFEGPLRPELERAIARTCYFPELSDIVLLEVHSSSPSSDSSSRPEFTLYHEAKKFSAMAETTGYSAAVVAFLIAEKQLPSGVQAIEQSVEAEPYLNLLQQLGIEIQRPSECP
jgi:lysine 6-dehydrogenase